MTRKTSAPAHVDAPDDDENAAEAEDVRRRRLNEAPPEGRLPRKPGSREVEPESGVDQAVDDSFPASDPPPWTP